MKINKTPRNIFGVISDVNRLGVVYYECDSYELLTDVIWGFLDDLDISSSNRRFEVLTGHDDAQHIRIVMDMLGELTTIRLKVKSGGIIKVREHFSIPAYKLYKREMTIKKILNND